MRRCGGASGRTLACSVGVALVLPVCLTGWLTGCVTEEKQKKADGYYKEGVAFMQDDRQRAFVSFQKAIQMNPRHKEARYYLGHLYADQGKFPQAEKELREVLRVDPDYSDAHNYLGLVLMEQDRWPEAIQSFRQALSDPLYGTPDIARYHLGVALAHEGDMEGAIQAFEDALLVTPPNVLPAEINLALGRAYYRLGRDAKAREVLQRVVSLERSGKRAVEARELLGRLKP